MLIRAADLVATPWRNGLGTSRTIADARNEHGGIAWQIGIADLETDAAFSDYAGCDRIFTPLGSALPALSIDGGPFEPCPLLIPKAFPGEANVHMRIAGRGRAFNLIVNRALFRAEVATGAVGQSTATICLTHCLRGTLAGAETVLESGDSWLGGEILNPADGAIALTVRIYARSPSQSSMPDAAAAPVLKQA